MSWIAIFLIIGVVSKVVSAAIEYRMRRDVEWLKIIVEACRPIRDRTYEIKLWNEQMKHLRWTPARRTDHDGKK